MATEEAQLAAQDNAQRQAQLKQRRPRPRCALAAAAAAAAHVNRRTRRHNTPYAGKLSCIMYNTYYIILCINMYYVLVPPEVAEPDGEPAEG